jgi:hypothetical protein
MVQHHTHAARRTHAHTRYEPERRKHASLVRHCQSTHRTYNVTPLTIGTRRKHCALAIHIAYVSGIIAAAESNK